MSSASSNARKALKEMESLLGQIKDITDIAGRFCVETDGRSGNFGELSVEMENHATAQFGLYHTLRGQMQQLEEVRGDDSVAQLPTLPDPAEDVQNDEKFKAYLHNLKKLRKRWENRESATEADDFDGEDLVDEGASSDVRPGADLCPYSKQPMEHPVKLLKCGHVFDKSSIDSMIAGKKRDKRFKCAFWGCVAYFTANEVVPV